MLGKPGSSPTSSRLFREVYNGDYYSEGPFSREAIELLLDFSENRAAALEREKRVGGLASSSRTLRGNARETSSTSEIKIL